MYTVLHLGAASAGGLRRAACQPAAGSEEQQAASSGLTCFAALERLLQQAAAGGKSDPQPPGGKCEPHVLCRRVDRRLLGGVERQQGAAQRLESRHALGLARGRIHLRRRGAVARVLGALKVSRKALKPLDRARLIFLSCPHCNTGRAAFYSRTLTPRRASSSAMAYPMPPALHPVTSATRSALRAIGALRSPLAGLIQAGAAAGESA